MKRKKEFSCQRCGACCRWSGYVLLTENDIAELSVFLGMTDRDFVLQYAELTLNRAQLSIKDGPDGACIFLEGKNCRVYPVRPAQCRDFPHLWRVNDGCPGLR